jgi:hypothetical protein
VLEELAVVSIERPRLGFTLLIERELRGGPDFEMLGLPSGTEGMEIESEGDVGDMMEVAMVVVGVAERGSEGVLRTAVETVETVEMEARDEA